jgi:Uncharacterized protein conserved in bacteria
MFLKSSINIIFEFYFILSKQLRQFYLNSSIYNKKISKIDRNSLIYKPNLNILSCLIKYEKKKNKIEDFNVSAIWENKNISEKDYRKLHNFYWLFTIDLKSSNKVTQKIILKWIDKNINYKKKNWEIDTLSKRIIAWLSNSQITYDGSDDNYKFRFDEIIKKQANQLINEINRSEIVDEKMIGCTANYYDRKFPIKK